MKRLQDKSNVLAPNATYPYGNIKNDTGVDDGTPVDVDVYADMHQFFEKTFDESGITANGLPDNETNGFQLYEALIEVIKKQTTYNSVAFNGIFNETLSLFNTTGGTGNVNDIFIKDNIMYIIFVSSNSIIRYDMVNESWLSSFAIGFNPKGIFVTDDRIYVTRSTTLNRAVYVYDLDGVEQVAEQYIFSTSSSVAPSKIVVIGVYAFVLDSFTGGGTEGIICLNMESQVINGPASIAITNPKGFAIYNNNIYLATSTEIRKYRTDFINTTYLQSLATPPLGSATMADIHIYGNKMFVTTNYSVTSTPCGIYIFALDAVSSNNYGLHYIPTANGVGCYVYDNILYIHTSDTSINRIKQNAVPNPYI